jgi:hypothetical protein
MLSFGLYYRQTYYVDLNRFLFLFTEYLLALPHSKSAMDHYASGGAWHMCCYLAFKTKHSCSVWMYTQIVTTAFQEMKIMHNQKKLN